MPIPWDCAPGFAYISPQNMPLIAVPPPRCNTRRHSRNLLSQSLPCPALPRKTCYRRRSVVLESSRPLLASMVLAIRCRLAARASSVRRSSPRSPSLQNIAHVRRRCHKSHEPRESLNTWPKKSRIPGPAVAGQLLATAGLSARVSYPSASTVPCCIQLV